MTDSRTTELLREGLTEQGIEWRSGIKGVTFVGDWCFVEYDNGKLAATCEPVLTPEQAVAATLGIEVNGETSDGYHTFNELYHHRAVLFSVIVRDHRELAWKARKHHDGTMYDGMFIVGIETPKGQATYHYDFDPYWEMFDCEEREYAPEWDGHTPDDAIARIAELGSEAEAAWNTRAHGTLTTEQVMAIAGKHQQPNYCSDARVCFDWQAIADELNAHAERTCKPSWVLQGKSQTQEFWRCECGNCGECFGVEDRSSFPFKMTIDEVEIPNFCPNCGWKVMDE